MTGEVIERPKLLEGGGFNHSDGKLKNTLARNETMGKIGVPLKRMGEESDWKEEQEKWKSHLGLEGSYPASFAVAPLVVENLITRQKWDMEILAGITSVKQEPETLAIVPQCGWAVREAVVEKTLA